ncbi:hypothetical protein EYF80_005353 [Liparis tanakae]|uniref:Uncharacterized protein n=1 Tax=Liparis tanakae TaxID=230148 RepID=A0A4Z2J2D2_9TELE|nr:hypothetical protein EYF80_005353 [Liparis tanakae]
MTNRRLARDTKSCSSSRELVSVGLHAGTKDALLTAAVWSPRTRRGNLIWRHIDEHEHTRSVLFSPPAPRCFHSGADKSLYAPDGELLLCSRLSVCLYGSSQPAGLYMWPRQERRPPRFPMNTFLLERFATATPTTEGNSEERGGSRFQCKENHFRYQEYSKKEAI